MVMDRLMDTSRSPRSALALLLFQAVLLRLSTSILSTPILLPSSASVLPMTLLPIAVPFVIPVTLCKMTVTLSAMTLRSSLLFLLIGMCPHPATSYSSCLVPKSAAPWTLASLVLLVPPALTVSLPSRMMLKIDVAGNIRSQAGRTSVDSIRSQAMRSFDFLNDGRPQAAGMGSVTWFVPETALHTKARCTEISVGSEALAFGVPAPRRTAFPGGVLNVGPLHAVGLVKAPRRARNTGSNTATARTAAVHQVLGADTRRKVPSSRSTTTVRRNHFPHQGTPRRLRPLHPLPRPRFASSAAFAVVRRVVRSLAPVAGVIASAVSTTPLGLLRVGSPSCGGAAPRHWRAADGVVVADPPPRYTPSWGGHPLFHMALLPLCAAPLCDLRALPAGGVHCAFAVPHRLPQRASPGG